MNNIKAIIMDVDGTLTNNKKVITKKTKDVLIEAQENGVILILASMNLVEANLNYVKRMI